MTYYAPSINMVVLAGAISTEPRLLSGPSKQKPDKSWSILVFKISSGSGNWYRGPPVYMDVAVYFGAEFWHSILRRRMPVAVMGELSTLIREPGPDGKPVPWKQRIVVREKGGIVMLYPRPSKEGPRYTNPREGRARFHDLEEAPPE